MVEWKIKSNTRSYDSSVMHPKDFFHMGGLLAYALDCRTVDMLISARSLETEVRSKLSCALVVS